MRKVTHALLGAALVVAVAGGSSAKKAGIGLEWSWVPTFQFGGFGLDISAQEFTLAWDLTGDFTVGVFTGSGTYNATNSYTNDLVAATPVDEELAVTGTTGVAGIRFLTNIPGMKMLKAGLEFGAMNVGAPAYDFTQSDGTQLGTNGAAFGLASPPALPARNAGMVGLTGRANLVEASNRNLTTAVTLSGSLRFVDIPDTSYLGTQEVNTVKAATQADKIDPVKSMTNFAVQLAVGIWF